MPRITAPLPTNRLLDRIPESERARVLSACVAVDVLFGEVLESPRAPIRSVYFPADSVIALLAPMGDGTKLEVALVGNEGVCGAALALGVDSSPLHALVQHPGKAWQMSAAAFRETLLRVPALHEGVDRYLFTLMMQLTHNVGCNRFHLIEQRVALWLLRTADRAHAPRFGVTHEFLAGMLGVRRVGITEAAGALQRRGLIQYSRGALTILDRRGLERAACACYRAGLSVHDQAFPAAAALGRVR